MQQSRRNLIILFSAIFVLLFTMIFFPLGADQSFFQIGGEMIAKKGAVPYRDFIDHKPLLFYLYSLSVLLFGSHEWTIRLFDVVYHSVALFFFYKILRRAFPDERIALLSVLFYTFYYVGGGYWITAEAESFAFLPMLLLADSLADFERGTSRKFLWTGIKISIAFLLLTTLKISFGLPVILGLISFVIFSSHREKKVKAIFLLYCGLFCTIVLGAAFLFFYAEGALPNLLLAMEWTGHYAALVPLFSADTFRQVYTFLFPGILINTLTATYIVLSIVGIVYSMSRKEKNAAAPDSVLQNIILWQLAWGLFGILYERRILDYHFTRIAWILMPFIAIAVIAYYDILRQVFRTKQEAGGVRLRRIVFHCLSIVILVFFSPIPKTMAQAISWVRTGLEHNTASRLRLLGMRNYQNESTERLAKFLSANLRPSDEVFLWGNYAKMYLDVKKLPPTFCIASPLLMAPWAPQIWKERMIDELGKAAPAYFIAEHNDGKFFMSGSPVDSYTYLLHWTSLREYLFTNYTLVDSSEHFTVYSRNKGI